MRPSPLAAALVGNFVLRLAGAATGLMLTYYLGFINRELYPVSATELGAIASGFYIVEMAAAPLLGAQSDRRGRRLLLVLGPLIGLVAVQLTAATSLLAVLFVTRLLEGLSTSCSTPALLGYLSARTEGDTDRRGKVMSLFEAGTTIGLTLGSVTGGLLWGALHRLGFVAIGAIYLLSAALFWLAREPATAVTVTVARPSFLASARRVLAYEPLLRFAPAWLAVNAIVGLWLNHAIYQMTEGHSQPGQYLVGAFSTGQLNAILGGYTLVLGLGVLGWGRLIGRVGELRTMRLTLGGIIGAGAMIGLMNHSSGPGPLLWIGLALFVLAVLLESGFPPAAVSYLGRLSGALSEDRGLVMGFYSVVLGLGQVLGSWLGGPFADRWGMDGVLALTFGLGLAAVALTLTLNQAQAGRDREGEGLPAPLP